MKKKIVYIVESFATGVFTFISDLTNALSDKYDFIILYGRRKETPSDLKKYFNENIKLIEIKNFRRRISLHDILAIKEIKKVLNLEKPDIIHLHSSKAGALGRLSIKNKKLFYTPHSYSFLNSNKIKRFGYKLIEKTLSKISNNCQIVACSKSEYDEAIKFNKNVTVISNSINTKNIDKYINSSEISDKSICTCGRICKQKNPRMFNSIAEAFPELEFYWIGDGKMRNVLTSKNIHVLGNLSHEEALKEVNKHQIFILPSFWEGLSISLLEALYLKKICLVSDIDSNKNIIKNNYNGFICHDKKDYINIINKITKEQIDINSVIDNAQKTILYDNNFKKMCEEYIKVYEQ